MEFFLVPLAVAAVYTLGSLRLLNQYERGVTFFLGKYTETKGPGLAFIPLLLARMKRVSLRVVALDVPVQDVITRDNISVKVNAVLYFRVADPMLAIIEIQDYMYATGQLAQTTLLSVLGQVELDELLAAKGERSAAPDHRRENGFLGSRDLGRRDKGCPASGNHAPRDCEAGRGRA